MLTRGRRLIRNGSTPPADGTKVFLPLGSPPTELAEVLVNCSDNFG